MDMMEIRRACMNGGELYPVGTDIVTKYIGRDSRGRGLFEDGKYINNSGELINASAYAASRIYIPINPRYTYRKLNWRVYNFTWYDANYKRISSVTSSNTAAYTLPKPPKNARFARFAVNHVNDTWNVQIVRIA